MMSERMSMFEDREIHEVEAPVGTRLLEDTWELKYAPEDLKEEGEGENKRFRLRGEFGMVDVPTANRRVYPRKVISREFERLAEDVKKRSVYGELGHPKDGKTDYTRVSHLITDLNLGKDGKMIGELQFIPGTINGNQAIAIARFGGMMGVSSRGFGSTIPDSKGNDIVQEDYKLVTFDVVADPANANAHPSFVVEQKERQMDVETLKKNNPDVVEALRKEIEADARDHAREALREEFDRKLREEAKEIREEAFDKARTELLRDPEVAGSSTAISKIKEIVTPFIVSEDENKEIAVLRKRLSDAERRVAASDDDLKQAREESGELAEIAKELGFHLFLEKEIGGNDRREQVMEMLGDVKAYKNLDNLKDRVAEILSALSEEDEVKEEYERRIKALEKENEKLSEERNKALKIGQQFGIRAYVERQVANHPRGSQLRSFISESGPETKDDVDRLVEGFNKSHSVSDEYSQIRRGIEKIGKKGKNNMLSEHEDRSSRRTRGQEIFGVSMDEIVKMSRIKR